MNWNRLKFWKSPDVAKLQDQNYRLQAICLLKDEAYLVKHLEFENFKKSAYSTLAAIALAHGGEYFLENTFSDAVSNNDFVGKLVVQASEEGLKISINTDEPVEEKTEEEVEGE